MTEPLLDKVRVLPIDDAPVNGRDSGARTRFSEVFRVTAVGRLPVWEMLLPASGSRADQRDCGGFVTRLLCEICVPGHRCLPANI